VDISVTVCLCVFFVCTVTDFSAHDKASGVFTAVHWRPKQGIANFWELCSPRSPKSDTWRVDVGSAYVDIRQSLH